MPCYERQVLSLVSLPFLHIRLSIYLLMSYSRTPPLESVFFCPSVGGARIELAALPV